MELNRKKRDDLKGYFAKGRMPTANHFADLIDSMVNQIEDGFRREKDYGLKLGADDDGDKIRQLVSMYQDIGGMDEDSPSWFIELRTDSPETGGKSDGSVDFGLSFSEPQKKDTEKPTDQTDSRLYLKPGGNVGVGTTTPAEKLDVNGFIASKGRIGTYQTGPNVVPADGSWYPILTDLTGLHVVEVVAAAYGLPGKGKYSVVHAIAMCTYGGSCSRVRSQTAWYRGFFQKIQLRWTKTVDFQYNLEIRTRSDFGEGSKIKLSVTCLLNDNSPQPDSNL